MRIETSEFAELHRRPGHDEAAPGITVGRITRFRLRSKKRDPVVVFQHGGVLEREAVAIETELRPGSAGRGHADDNDCADPPDTRCFTPDPKHQIKSGPRRWPFCFRRKYPAGETFDIVFPIIRRLEPWKSPPIPGAALHQHWTQ